MENKFVYKLRGTLEVKIEGRDVKKFLLRINQHKIEILNIKEIKYNKAIILIYKDDYQKLKEIKTIYDIGIVDTKGIPKIKSVVKNNKIFLLASVLGLLFLILLSNVIYEIEIVHLNKNLRELIKDELNNYGISEYKFRKNYDYIEKVKKNILNNHKDKIEWLEIERKGTKYIVRLEERLKNEDVIPIENRHIVAKKDSIIKGIFATSGEIVKELNEYVTKDEIVISGEIKLYDNVKARVGADGEIFGETWYEVTVSYPLSRVVEEETGKSKKSISLNFLNKKFNFFDFKKYKNKKITKEKVLFKVPLLPIYISYNTEKEIIITDEVHTIDSATNKAFEKGKEEILSKLNNKEYIIDQKKLQVNIKSSKIELDMFFAIYENITSYRAIIEEDVGE